MKSIMLAAMAVAIAGFCGPVAADPDKDESGNGRKYERRGSKGGEQKEEYWDGNCKVERKWEKSGEYKEERKCDGPPQSSRRNSRDYPPAESHNPAIVVRPPSVVIQPPAIVIQPPRIKID